MCMLFVRVDKKSTSPIKNAERLKVREIDERAALLWRS